MGSITEKRRVDPATGKTITVFRAYVRRTGFASKSKVCGTRTEARNWLRDNEGATALERERQASGRTLAQVIELLANASPTKGTRYWTAQHLAFWREQLGARPARDITRGDITRAVAVLQARPAMRSTTRGPQPTARRLTPSTVNRYLASLSSVFNYALDHEFIDAHPMKGGKVRKLDESGRARRRVLTVDEEARLMEAARASTWPMLALFVRMCLTTAARKSEVLKLRWQQVQLEDSIALLGRTKNGRPRALPLVEDVRAALAEAAKVKPLRGDYVFFDPRDPTRPKAIKTAWEACRRAAGLLKDREDPLDHVVLHTTRHSAVTRMLRGGANLAQAAAVSGHQTLAMLKRYEHLVADDAVHLAQRLLAGSAR